MISSLIMGTATHHCYNRIIVLHQVQYSQYVNNIGYTSKGHSLFVEDGVEWYNVIKHNLIFNTRPSYGLTDEDVHPANFWMKHPLNFFEDNVAGGSTHYGVWYSLNDHPQGPAATDSICPINEPLGTFENNIAHSVGRYGLRVFPGHQPRMKPCSGYSDTNLPVMANYNNFTSYKNQRNGAFFEYMGAFTANNFYVVDVIKVGIEVGHVMWNTWLKAGYVKNACVIGVGKENT